MIRVPSLQFVANKLEPEVDYRVNHKYLVLLDRIVYRDVKKFQEYIVTKFNLPSEMLNESVLIQEDQDRIVMDLSQIF